jgi:hypothetical protein
MGRGEMKTYNVDFDLVVSFDERVRARDSSEAIKKAMKKVLRKVKSRKYWRIYWVCDETGKYGGREGRGY